MPVSSTPPQLNQVISRDQRQAAGIGSAYVDNYNNAQLAKYNNEYNYWLWQQQQEYNSPKAQMERYREAGLNPNFAATDSGNVSNIPRSDASFKSNIFDNKMQAIGTGIQAFNSLLGAAKQGVDMVSQISGLPNDIPAYRKALTSFMKNNARGSEYKAYNQIIDTMYNAWLKGGSGYFDKTIVDLGQDAYGNLMSLSFDPGNSIAGKIQNEIQNNWVGKNSLLEVTEGLRKYELNTIKPEEFKLLQERISLIGKQAGLSGKELEYWNTMAFSKVGSNILRTLLMLAK